MDRVQVLQAELRGEQWGEEKRRKEKRRGETWWAIELAMRQYDYNRPVGVEVSEYVYVIY